MLAELSNCANSVQTHPVNAFQHFVNTFVYLNNSYSRQDAVRKTQAFKNVKIDEKNSILKEAFWKLEMTTKRKIIKYGPIETCINTKSAFC